MKVRAASSGLLEQFELLLVVKELGPILVTVNHVAAAVGVVFAFFVSLHHHQELVEPLEVIVLEVATPMLLHLLWTPLLLSAPEGLLLLHFVKCVLRFGIYVPAPLEYHSVV